MTPQILTRFLWLLALSISGFAHADATPLKAVQVAERVWFVQGQAALGTPENRNFISNAGFVVTDEGVVVVFLFSFFLIQNQLLLNLL